MLPFYQVCQVSSDKHLTLLEFLLGTTKMWYSDGFQPKQMWFEVQTSIVALKAYGKHSQKGIFWFFFFSPTPFLFVKGSLKRGQVLT